MAREKTDYRANIANIREMFPDVGALTVEQTAHIPFIDTIRPHGVLFAVGAGDAARPDGDGIKDEKTAIPRLEVISDLFAGTAHLPGLSGNPLQG